MPFDFKAYDQKCQGLTLEELQREWEHYTRLISGAATSTAVSGCAIPLTLGVSTIGVAMAAPAIHNARKKREIIERHLNRLNATHHTRKRDVLGSMAVSGTIGVVTLGVGTMGAEAVATAGAEHGIQSIVANETAIKIVSHAALDGAGMAVEHAHTDHLKKKDAKKAFKKAGVFKAVQDAKAAEAGYVVQPYPNNGQYPAYAAAPVGPSQALPMPPPPYSAAVGQAPVQPTYALSLNGYPQDFKDSLASQPTTQSNVYLAPNMTGQQSLRQPYDYAQQQQVPVCAAPSPIPPLNGQIPPQTPAVHYSLQKQVPYQQQAGNVLYNLVPTPQPFDMSAMQQALPMAVAPHQLPPQQYPPTSPPQDNSQNYTGYSAQHHISSQISQAPQAGYFPPPPATPSGHPPAIAVPHQPTPQPVPASQVPFQTKSADVLQSPVQQVVQHHNGYQPTTPIFQPQNQGQPGYPTPQQSNMDYQPQMHPAVDLNRRDSLINNQTSFTPQPYNPQNYGPITHQEKAYNVLVPAVGSTPIPAPQAIPSPMQYQMPPTPLPTGSTVSQFQHDNKGSYFPTQPQTPQATGQSGQSTQPAYQPQYYPPTNCPLTPMHQPMPVTQ